MKGKTILIALLLATNFCSYALSAKKEKIARTCWKEHGDNFLPLVTDSKCADDDILDRIRDIVDNRLCGYADFYNGKRNIDDLSNLSRKDRKHVNLVISCTDKYLKEAPLSPDVVAYAARAKSSCFKKLAKDKSCDIPKVRERLAYMIEFGDPNRPADKSICHQKS